MAPPLGKWLYPNSERVTMRHISGGRVSNVTQFGQEGHKCISNANPMCLTLSIRFATVDVMQKYGSLLERYATNSESLNMAIMTMMYHVAGDCCRGNVLLQLPVLKTFSEIWGDLSCDKYVS